MDQANIYPHTVLDPIQQGPDITMGDLTGMATGPDFTLSDPAQQRIPRELARMMALEQKSMAPQGIVRRRNS